MLTSIDAYFNLNYTEFVIFFKKRNGGGEVGRKGKLTRPDNESNNTIMGHGTEILFKMLYRFKLITPRANITGQRINNLFEYVYTFSTLHFPAPLFNLLVFILISGE